MDATVEAALVGIAGTRHRRGRHGNRGGTSARNSRRTNQATIDAAHTDTLLALETSREAQFADRYSQALEQLGSDNLDVRIGGIYALEGIALDSPRHHPTVMEVLTAFIREHQLPSSRHGGRFPTSRQLSRLSAAARQTATSAAQGLACRLAVTCSRYCTCMSRPGW
jgi:hypothetical protein